MKYECVISMIPAPPPIKLPVKGSDILVSVARWFQKHFDCGRWKPYCPTTKEEAGTCTIKCD